MSDSDFLQNVLALRRELDWFRDFLAARLERFFQPEVGDPFQRFPAPDLDDGESMYALFVRHYQLKPGERLVLLLALIPHIEPELLDPLLLRNQENARFYTQFGGLAGQQHNGFLPTGETAVFLLAGADLLSRIMASRLFEETHPFHMFQILSLEDTRPGEPRLSGQLVLSAEALSLITSGYAYQPPFSEKFPARLLRSPLEWEDLVLDSATLDELETIRVWLAEREEADDKAHIHRGWMAGFRVLFHGPPGTGKSLTAALMGNMCRRPVYRIDLSRVVSKYIGETEKNLASLFAQSENKDWILFFDEADALFGKRTELTDAKDKYANQETSYLLQRIEDFQGLVILATNFRPNIDSAFLRRFQSVVCFKPPGVSQRIRLWEKALARIPGSHAVDVSRVATDFEVTGGFIANAVQYAWLLCRRNKSPLLTHADVLQGIKREFAKEGRVFNT